ncbi:accessory Sec system translocase SecA2 [Pseudobacteroides cellulosolvens]|uniref:Protein translocase subunit SecA n=1 Tax=Pseudobacteroides cellulosolvens ATCC 35603 = DSM 2933 TaxID=398512 RepID=A0A0L6JP18_9FIRM|nr:accessory Sec system translocase SecA2 [Pseudobacteroides cellulosolvens]KNY27523.1 Protein translocase subunit secA [Pseudobacteroides cellulosolvens ATCC 35603 = DSM 2933]
MFNKLSQIGKKIQGMHIPVSYNIDHYNSIVEEINKISLSDKSESDLRNMAIEIRKKVKDGTSLDDVLVEAYALGREVSHRTLGMRHYDVQLIAGIALHEGKMVEMQTGEGKTLAAVLPAYLNSLTGKGVHILTFNDYLVHRDMEWMKPIYDFLGVTVGYIKEGMSIKDRQNAYRMDITYVTAKEAGFDYLKDFLCIREENLVHRGFNYAIVDEADSILIDEARIPLVIAGSQEGEENDLARLSALAKELIRGTDYAIDQNGSNVYLTDFGLCRVERLLGCSNLYEEPNLKLLTQVNSALFAEALLKRDRDYIVRDGKIELVDEFTGRVADKRHWPDNIQAAVEAKEALNKKSRGIIMSQIALQHFINLYPRIAGMTGTAKTSANEFHEFYGVDVVVVPTNKPCIRKDCSDMIFVSKEAKKNAIIAEIRKAHEKGQPVLIGTGSVEESERLYKELHSVGIEANVLNAKNDEMEAEIVAKSGMYGAVTVSTNMAGRGVDIKLGGENGERRDEIIAAGGLYVIGTGKNESRRIDNQLKGRAGRQGDPGKSRLFISLEDDLMVKYDLTKLVPLQLYPEDKNKPFNNSTVNNELNRGQRTVEGYNSDVRRQLLKYSFIIEEQRKIVCSKRQDILQDKAQLKILKEKSPEKYDEVLVKYGEKTMYEVEKQLTLFFINKHWAEYLEYMNYTRESIHLVVMGRKNPMDEFHKIAIEAFSEMLGDIENDIVSTFERVEITKDGIDMEKEGLTGPSSTWTYLINDSPDQFSNLPHLVKAFSTRASGTLFSLSSIYKKIFGRKTITK